MESKDEFVHEYPKPLDAHWKENWYFNFIDRENRAWGVNHISLERHRQRGRFSAFHVIDNTPVLYSTLIDIDDNFSELTDGRLKFEFLEPFKKFRVTFDGKSHQLELDYDARFQVFDYALTRRPGKKGVPLEHYEQALWMKGVLTREGETRNLSGYGHRDHSWGYRNESKVTAWNWVAAQFQDRTINLYRAVIGPAFVGSGFVSSKDGNRRIVRMNIEQTEFDGKGPASSTYLGIDETGEKWRLRSQKFSSLFLPLKEKGDGVVIHENFAEFKNLDTDETGVGIDEYLINPDR